MSIPPLRRILALSLLLPLAAAPHGARAAWPHDPRVNLPIATTPATEYAPVVVADGTGGAIVAWDVLATPHTIGAQRVTRDGSLLWGPTGVTAASNTGVWGLVGDGARGAYVAWATTPPAQILAQHLDGTGAPLWGGGVSVASGLPLTDHVWLGSDGAGGVVIGWQDAGAPLFLQRLDAGGALLWPNGGSAVPGFPALASAILPAGDGGVTVLYQDNATG